jgi:uncharacterized repeat protein (TIGR03803 family)
MKRKESVWKLSSALLLVIVVTQLVSLEAWAGSNFKTLYRFSGGEDGSQPYAGLIFDARGNLYGTTYTGGEFKKGTVFKLTADAKGRWTESVLYSFRGGNDGQNPLASLIFGADGNLYGTTPVGGGMGCMFNQTVGCGIIFRLTPSHDGTWKEVVLYRFKGGKDGSIPISSLISDSAANLYGTAQSGGDLRCEPPFGCGVVFKLTPTNGEWQETVLHAFTSDAGGENPDAGLIFDIAANLYGTTEFGGISGNGVVFQLAQSSEGQWKETILHRFNGSHDGSRPTSVLTFDQSGNLYGTTVVGGFFNSGTVFKLTSNSGGSWKESVIHTFNGPYGASPIAGVMSDQAGNLYGTTAASGAIPGCGCGLVFRLEEQSNGKWRETVVHRFTDGPGAFPTAGVIFDAAGNIYGTTSGDSTATFGSVFVMKP